MDYRARALTANEYVEMLREDDRKKEEAELKQKRKEEREQRKKEKEDQKKQKSRGASQEETRATESLMEALQGEDTKENTP